LRLRLHLVQHFERSEKSLYFVFVPAAVCFLKTTDTSSISSLVGRLKAKDSSSLKVEKTKKPTSSRCLFLNPSDPRKSAVESF
jgi:hypothetical protein